jgi:single-strand DNA-binding protein
VSINVNSVHLAGRLTRDPEMRAAGQSNVAGFGLAINRTWKDAAGEKKEEVTFIDIEVWGKTAEIAAQYLRKGSGCYVEGRLKLDTWEDPQGQKRSKIKVVAEKLQLGDRPKDGGGGGDAGGEGEEDAAIAGARRAQARTQAPARAAAPARPAAGGADDEPPF